MPLSSTTPTSYDAFPYRSFPYRATHPDRLATLASLFGMTPAPATRCRVLEIACASGGNLVPMAAALPDSRFLGIDLARTSIDRGRAWVSELGLSNVELRHMDLMDAGRDLGQFDYIIAHGVFSWVPPAVQTRILELFQELLAPQGVGFLSHNVYPGWYARKMAREMMRFHGGQFASLEKQLEQGRALLEFVTGSTRPADQGYRQLLERELQILREKPDWYLRHDHFAEHNDALYFHELVERLEGQGLQYLGDSDFASMVPGEFTPEVAERLHAISRSAVVMEQYLDFVRNRVFRHTLVCRSDVPLVRELYGRQLTAFEIAAPMRMAVPGSAFSDTTAVTFQHSTGAVLPVEHTITQAAMAELSAEFPRSIAFHALRTRARARLGAGAGTDSEMASTDTVVLGKDLLRHYAQGFIELSLRPPDFVTTVSHAPVAWPLARAQSVHDSRVTNLRHESVDLDAPARAALALLDGSRDRDALHAAGVEENTLEKLARFALLSA